MYSSFLAPILIALTLGYLATLIARLTGTVYIPYLLALGIVVGPVLALIKPSEAYLLFYNYVGPIGAAFVILAESAKIPRYLLRRIVKPLSMMLTFVLFVTGITTGVILVFLLKAPVWVGFVVGAIISSTDPASVITSLRKTKVSEVPSTLLITESVFNDPFSYLFLVIVILIFLPGNISYIQSPSFSFNSIFLYVLFTQGLFPILISGALFGLLYLLRVKLPKDFKEYYTAMFLLFGLSAYSITVVAGGSGYMAAAIFGVLSGNFMPRDTEFESYKSFMDNISTFAAILIFVFLGASINLSILISFLIPGVLISLILIFVVRPFAVVLAGSVDLNMKYGDLLFVGLEGTRGIFPAILAPTVLIIGTDTGNVLLQYWGQAIEAIVLIIIFTSLTVQPLLMGRIYRALHKEEV
ncbi:MAG: cation:proton antiporter [Candidatus Thermoplasmatota archaeon]|nr:cation:proton antiporter [Candidatus Thermoplasmatota archaeon]MCL5790217.1 cation:proton antiporter [Candidatus Thermoplasmatota archaeon]